jgi:hydrogenase maturation protein HypF
MGHARAIEWGPASTNSARTGSVRGKRVCGLVRGADFRPTVWRLAQDCGLVGEVWSDPDADGVMVEAWGDPDVIEAFVRRFENQTPLETSLEAEEATPRDAIPKFWLERFSAGSGAPIPVVCDNPIAAAARALRDGAIVAIKGVGGFHLTCDAHNEHAVRRLRICKGRAAAPLALMAGDIETIRRYCAVDEREAELLASPAAPIVILRASGPERLSDSVAPGRNTLGFMLARAPTCRLLLELGSDPLVTTSGNRADEPQCVDNDEARRILSSVADYGLFHDHRIVRRADESVAKAAAGEFRVMRRARGYAPAPIGLPEGFERAPPVLALGGELQNTFCLVHDGQAILSPHIGDLEHDAVFEDYRKALLLYRRLFDHRPEVVAVDMDADCLSTQVGVEWAGRHRRPVEKVQHHHAHIASCLVENGAPLNAPPVLGVALDDLGRGADGGLWGGEFLLADYTGFERLASFAPVAMPGGERATRQPWRNTLAHLDAAVGWDQCLRRHGGLELIRYLKAKPVDTLRAMISRQVDSPPASSCARLFDAVAAAVGLCREDASYDGQAAHELESRVDERALRDQDGYPVAICMVVSQCATKTRPVASLPTLEFGPMWRAILRDLERKAPVGVIAARFHLGLATGVAEMARLLLQREGSRLSRVAALSGCSFQNSLLLELVSCMLKDRGFEVLANREAPANDGGLSLGQAAVAAARRIRTHRA